jgi:hypothetical protein
MTWREKKDHIINKVYVNPKNKVDLPNSPLSPSVSPIPEETKRNILKPSPVMEQVIKIQEHIYTLITYPDPTEAKFGLKNRMVIKLIQDFKNLYNIEVITEGDLNSYELLQKRPNASQ